MQDLVIGVTTRVPTGSQISAKPSYLIYIEEDGTGKNKKIKRFITLDRPELLNGFVQVKGFFSELSDDEIINNYPQVLTTAKKELILEVMFPWHKIHSIRSLVFKAK
jgi:hypothetical protein